MKGKRRFSEDEAREIRDLLRTKTRADRDEQKKLRQRLRRLGFYISDFTDAVDGFSRADFDALVSRGTIKVLDEARR